MDPATSAGATLRDARSADAEALARLCRRAFPTGLRWQGPTAGPVAWWRAVLERPSSETLLLDEGESLVGFALLVLDEAGFRVDRAAARRGAWGDLAAAWGAPGAGWAELRSRVRERLGRPGRPRAPETQLVAIVPPPERTWLDLIAVDPDHARRGHGAVLLAELEKRTRAHGRRAIGLAVDAENRPARTLYERAGYRPTRVGTSSVNYVKVL